MKGKRRGKKRIEMRRRINGCGIAGKSTRMSREMDMDMDMDMYTEREGGGEREESENERRRMSRIRS